MGSRAARMHATDTPMRVEVSWNAWMAPAVPMLTVTGAAFVTHTLMMVCGLGAKAKTDELMATEPPAGKAVMEPGANSLSPLCKVAGMTPPEGRAGHSKDGSVEPKPIAGCVMGSSTVGHGAPPSEMLKYSIVCICRVSAHEPAGSRAPKSSVHSPLVEEPAGAAKLRQRVMRTPPRTLDVQFCAPRDSTYMPA